MRPTGRHIAMDCYNCAYEPLHDAAALRDLLSKLFAELQLTLTGYHAQPVEGNGLAIMALFESGHLTLHTYPDIGFAAADFFTCYQAEPIEAVALTLKKALHPGKTKVTHLKRGDFGCESDMKPKIHVHTTSMKRVKQTGEKVIRLLKRPKSS